MERIDLRKIRTDGGTQPRAGVDVDTVADYAQELNDGATFPPVTLFYDGSNYWLADGFHRLRAYKHCGKQRIDAEVKQGTLRDAQLFAVGANATHGLRRSREDKRRAVTMLLEDEEWVQWSNREIARRCKVSDVFVGNMRKELGLTANVSSENGRKYITKHGTESVMKTPGVLNAVVRDWIINELKTTEPARLASHARALTVRGYTDLWKKLGGEGDTTNLRMVLFSLAKEWESQVPQPTQPTPQPPAVLKLLAAIHDLTTEDLDRIHTSTKHELSRISRHPSKEQMTTLAAYYDALEATLCALRPN